MPFKKCKSCGQEFRPHPQVPSQTYCSVKACQCDRRRLAQMARRYDDPDYRDNDDRANKAWAVKNPSYWKQYRASHPEYVERNRKQQQVRNKRKQSARIANVAESVPNSPFPSGRYRLARVTADCIANEAHWIVEITYLSDASGGHEE